ncbi:MAG: hypothetical protein WB816_11090 [Methylocystis sp.]
MLALRLLLAAVALSIGACAATDHFQQRIDRYDLAAAESRDQMIFTNILRASRAEPLSFVQMGQITGSTTAAATVGLPSIILGPHIPVATSLASNALQSESIFGGNPLGGSGYTGNSVTMNGSTNFQVTPSETKEFYNGLLAEVEPHTLEFFVQQGIARELLFYLFTDKVIEERGGKRRELRNDPLDPTFPEFQKYVRLAMAYGLSSEPVREKGGASKTNGAKTVTINLTDATAKSDDQSTKQRQWRLCFNQLYKSPNAPPAANAPSCGDSTVSRDNRVVSFIGHEGARVELHVLPRSAFAIFKYLGRIVAGGEQARVTLFSEDAIDRPPFNDDQLFVVQEGVIGDCFVSEFFEGKFYCVPREGAVNTKRVLGLLTQLIALNTSISQIPVAPTVQLLR